MNIALWLRRTAQVRGAAPALFHGYDMIEDYAGFDRRAGQIASWLRQTCVLRGDRVALYMKNHPDYLILLYGIWYAGAVAVPINAKLHPREAAWITDNAGAVLTFVSSGMVDELAQVGATGRIVSHLDDALATAYQLDPVCDPAECASADLAWLFYTSGTTGRPKGVMITHQMLSVMAQSYLADVDAVTPDHCAIYAAPISHGAGLYVVQHVLMGARHVVPASGGFDGVEILDLAAHFGQAHLFAAPTMVKRLTAQARATGSVGTGLRSVVYAGGPMYLADIIEAVETFGPIFLQVYGQGECPMSITALSRADVADRSHPRWRERLGSVGRAQSVCEVRIGGPDGSALAPGEVGEITVRGPNVMPGYWQNDNATTKTIRDGWLMTGDVGYLDSDGYVTLQDRSKDVIISGGSNIYPREVEEVLLLHPEVSEVSVVGRPDPEWGEDVVAFVVASVGCAPDEQALSAHCLEHIARFKRPKAYFMLNELPKNNYGKVLKTELRARLAQDGG
ncbi:long-chain fatty acid--CoA ligase [Pseudohalocynthiibacter aestuariivivens]|nr:AMP-binding protein [Pseudohalocynthiibacter aestuariivivens]QIE45083.1 long-chain fatty acid--CoA ligase [Pseudohalocynthiibacter aestuariivivens]